MAGEIIHSSEDLFYVSTQFDDSKATVTGGHKYLVVSLDDLGKPWGDDVHGKLFGENFEPAMEKVIQTLEDIAKGLDEIGFTFVTMATDVKNTEENQT
jgi:hypothetical protein